ncbi:MAG: hypothetical protein ACI9K5_003392, partial [Gammaproteobacteria bacterium]
MTSTGNQPKRRWRRRLLTATCLLGLALGGLYLGRNRFLGPFVLARLQPTIEARLGGSLSVEHYSGNWFSGLRLDGVAFERGSQEGASEGPLVELVGARVDASFSLRRLLSEGMAGLTALEIRIERLVLDPMAPFPPVDSESESETTFPAELPKLDVRVDEIELYIEGASAAVHDLSLESKNGQLLFQTRELLASAGDNQLLARGIVLPLGMAQLDALDVPGIIATAQAELQLSLKDLPDLAARLGLEPAAAAQVTPVPEHDIELSLSLESNRLELTAGSALAAGG